MCRSFGPEGDQDSVAHCNCGGFNPGAEYKVIIIASSGGR